MSVRCPLCRRRVPRDAQEWCDCGAAMDPRCRDTHDDWCPSHGDERWLGATEL